MGKQLIQQRRGRGTVRYLSPSFNFKGKAQHYPTDARGVVTDIVHCGGHTSPLMEIAYENGEKGLTVAPERIKIGDPIVVGQGAGLNLGNVLPLKDIPEGTLINNIELRPGDGGKMVRTSGAFARIISKTEEGIRIILPSRKEKLFLPDCRAAIGTLAGSGRLEKPFLKAGTRFKKMRVRNRLYPKVCGISMNAVDHPFGGKCSHIKGRPTLSPRNAPPGRKVGKIAPRRTGRIRK